jgi:hypothetical protein
MLMPDCEASTSLIISGKASVDRFSKSLFTEDGGEEC